MHIGRKLALFSFGLFMVFGSATTLAAPSDFNLTTSPLPIDLSTKPGQPISTQLRVQNSGTKAMTLKVSLKKFKAYGASGNPQINDCGPADDFCSWVSFSKSSFLAQPGRWYSIGMTISPPKDAGFGYYYAVIFSNANPGKAEQTRSNVLTGATATLVLLDVNAPGEKRQLSLSDFSASHKLYEYLPADFSVSVHNNGNVHLIPSGSIFIQRGGKTIATLDLNPNGGNVLPGSSRIFKASWKDGFPVFETKTESGRIVSDNRGQPVETLNFNQPIGKLRFGHYTAHLILTYNDGSRDIPLQGDVSFWVIPYKAILLLIALYLVPLVILKKRPWRLITRKSKKGPRGSES